MEKGRFGPYEAIERIGSGGFAEVWLAEVVEPPRDAPELRPGQRVALKRLLDPPAIAAPQVRVRFDQEAAIMKGLDHPNVVEVLDVGNADAGRGPEPYLALEFVRGRTLEKVIAAGPVDEALALAVAKQVTAGLVAMQARRVCHRDIKPANLILADDGGVVKIMDFGCARAPMAPLWKTQIGDRIGTLLYFSPEQLGGDPDAITNATDLYALGLVLYELLVGHHPYYDGKHFDLSAIELTVPETLRSRGVSVSPFFEALVLTLLEKKPADRIADAATLQTILEERERSAWWRGRPRQAARGLPSGLLQAKGDGGLHGRADLMQTLTERWDDAVAGRGRALLIHAPDGAGKSRLVYELADHVARAATGAAVLYGVAYPGGVGVAPGAIRSALVGFLGEAGLEETVQRYLGAASGLAAAYAAFLRGEQALQAGPPLDGDAIRSATTKVLLGIASERPILLVVEELHLSSDEGRALFTGLAHAIADARILLIGTGTSALSVEWRNSLVELAHGDVFELMPLSEDAVRDIVAERVRGEDARRVADVLAGHADGNPLYVQDFLREFEEADHVLPPLPPPRIRDLEASRVHRMNEEEREVLELAAVVGFRFDPTVVAEVLDRPVVPLLRLLAHVHHARGMVRPADENYAFDSHALHELLLSEISLPLRREYHALVARVLEGRLAEAGDDESRAGPLHVQLANHYLEAGRRDDCLAHLEPAFAFVKSQHRHSDATALVDRALAAPGILEGNDRLEWLITLAEEHALYMHASEERRALHEALALVEEGSDCALRARLAWRRSIRARVDGQLPEAEALAREGLGLAEACDDTELVTALLAHVGYVLTLRGSLSEAQETFERLLALEDGEAPSRSRAHAHSILGQIAEMREDHEAAVESFRACLTEVKRLDSQTALAISHLNLGGALNEASRCDEAIPHLEESLAISRTIGLKGTAAKAVSNLTAAYMSKGRLADAIAMGTEALEHHEAAGDRSGSVRARRLLGSLWLACGLIHEAEGYLRRAHDEAASMGDTRLQASCKRHLADLCVESERTPEALAWLADAEQLFSTPGSRRGSSTPSISGPSCCF